MLLSNFRKESKHCRAGASSERRAFRHERTSHGHLAGPRKITLRNGYQHQHKPPAPPCTVFRASHLPQSTDALSSRLTKEIQSTGGVVV